ncbi:MAG: S-layer homology domain-containing protein [Fervidobacterium sp.]
MRRFFVSIICVLLAISTFAAYKDVDESHWAYEAISTLGDLEIITGFPDGTYRGNEVITRYQVAVLMYRLYSVLNQRLEELKAKLNTVESQMNSRIDQMSISQSIQISTLSSLQKADFDKQLNDLKVTLNILSENVKKVSQDFSDLSATTSKLSKDIADSKNQYNDLKKLLNDVYDKYGLLYTKVGELENQLNLLVNYVNEADKKIESVEKSLENKLALLEAEIGELKKELAELEKKEVDKPTTGVSTDYTYDSDIEEVKAKLEYLTKQQAGYKSIESDIAKLREEVGKTKEEVEKLRAFQMTISGSSPNNTQVLPEEVARIFEEIESIKRDLKELREPYQIGNEELNVDTDRIKILENKLSTLSNEVARLSLMSNQIQSDLDKIKQMVNNMSKNGQGGSVESEILTDLDSLFEDMKSRILASAEMNALIASVDQFTKLESNVDSVKQKVSFIEQKIEELSSKVDEKGSVNELKEIKAEVENLKEILSELGSISVDSQAIEKISKAIELKNQDLGKLSDEIFSLTRRVDDLANKMSEISDRISRLSQNTGQELQQIEMDSLKNRVKNLEQEMQNKISVAQLNSVNLNVQKVLTMVLDLEEKVKALQEKVVKMPEGSQIAQSQQSQVKSSVEVDLSRYANKEDLDNAFTEVSNLKRELSAYSSQLDKLSKEVSEKLAGMSISKIEDEVLQEVSRLAEDVARLDELCTKLSQEIDSKIGRNEFKKEITSSFIIETTSIWYEIEEIEQCMSEMRDNIKAVVNSVDDLSERMKGIEEREIGLSKGLATVVEKTVTIENFEISTKGLASAIEQVYNENSGLKVQLVKVEDRMNKLEGDNAKLMNSSQELEKRFEEMVTIEMMQENLETLETKILDQLQILQDDYANKLAEMDEKLTVQSVSIETKLDELTATMESKVTQLSEKDTQFEKSISELAEKQIGVEKTIDGLKESSAVILEEASTTSERISKLESELENEKRKTSILMLLLIGVSLGFGFWIYNSL